MPTKRSLRVSSPKTEWAAAVSFTAPATRARRPPFVCDKLSGMPSLAVPPLLVTCGG